MARIVLSTVGIRGDLNPFLGIGAGLRSRGHDVLFVVEEVLAPAVVAEGFSYRPLTGDVMTALSPHIGDLFSGATLMPSVRAIIRHWLAANLRSKVDDLLAASRGADLMVARATHLAAPIAAELAGLPRVQVTMTPLTVPSAYVNPQLLPLEWPRQLPRPVNRLAWALIEAVMRHLADGPVNEVRASLGLGPTRDVMGRGDYSRVATAVLVSRAFMVRPPDWPDYIHVTGYCFWDTPSAWREPPDLAAFLNRGAPVVGMSFGSLAPFVGEALQRVYRTALKAVLASGLRALVIGAAPGTLPNPLPAGVLSLPFAPFSHVYPRCAAVINHGGAYTVAEALRSAVPSLSVPWGIDQFFTAAQLGRLGAGRWIHHRRFSDRTARRQLSRLLDDSSYRSRARTISGQIAEEDGIAALCDVIEAALPRMVQPSTM